MSKNDIKALNFEASLGELEEIVRKLESGSAPLESAIELYSRGVELKTHCESILNSAKLKVEKILAQDGKVQGTEEFSEQ